jgi:hypothetical protein
MISRSGVWGLNFTKRSTNGSLFLSAVNARVGHEPNGIIQLSFTKRGQRVNGGVAGGLQLGEGGAREIFVEEKFHSPEASGFDAFHRRQIAGKFQTRADVQIFERRIILQNVLHGLPAGNRTDNIGDKNARATHHGFAVANGGIETDVV